MNDETRARELLSREYGKDHPAARHGFTLSFLTTSYEHRVRELAREFAAVRAQALTELPETKPNPWQRLGEWLCNPWNPGRCYLRTDIKLGVVRVELCEQQTMRVATGEGPTLDEALVNALEKLP